MSTIMIALVVLIEVFLATHGDRVLVLWSVVVRGQLRRIIGILAILIALSI
jgi:hypothetical protein